MKWTMAFLVLLGVLASICVVLLVNAFRADGALRKRSGETTVVLAVKDLPAMTVVTSEMIKLDTVKIKEAPDGCYTGPTQVIGKILAVPVVKEQVLTRTSFISDGTGAQLAAALPAGMRAVSVNLSSQSISGGLLYPGCVVDVLASFKLGGSRDTEVKGEAISTTLLHAVQVLAIAGESVLSKPEMANDKEKSSASGRNLTVTLLLDPKQAEALQLATENGTISLAMRNPLDKAPMAADATVLSRGKLSRLGSLLGTSVKQAVYTQPSGEPVEGEGEEAAERPVTAMDAFSGWSDPEPSHWGVTVIRGDKVEEEELKVE